MHIYFNVSISVKHLTNIKSEMNRIIEAKDLAIDRTINRFLIKFILLL